MNIFFKIIYDIFNKFTMEKLKKISIDKDEIIDKYLSLVKNCKSDEIILLHHLSNIYSRVQSLGGVYFGAVYEEKRLA